MSEIPVLLACPFCGRTTVQLFEADVGGVYTTVVCRTCFAGGPEGTSREEAAQLWNTRAVVGTRDTKSEV